MKITQHEKILQLHENRAWVCQTEYWRSYIFSPHKRRSDIEQGRARGIMAGTYHFESKDCEHGIKGSRDYLLVRRVDSVNKQYGQITESGIYKEIPGFEGTLEQLEKLNL